MAANLWRTVLGIQLALAVGAAFTVREFAPPKSAWLTAALAGCAFIALQYLLGLLAIASSRMLARPAAGSSRAFDALLAGVTEPIYFGMAELSMAWPARAAPPPPPRGGREPGPLLLVHGLVCNSGVWRWLLPRLHTAGFRSIHAVNLEPLAADIDVLARALAREITDFHRAQGNVPITVLAHSMGGLLCRAALRDLDPRWVRRLVTIATPHHGTSIARLLGKAPVRQMRTDSSWLDALNTAQQGRLPVPITSIFSLDDNLVAPASSPALAGAQLLALPALGHFGLLISRRATDRVLQALRESS